MEVDHTWGILWDPFHPDPRERRGRGERKIVRIQVDRMALSSKWDRAVVLITSQKLWSLAQDEVMDQPDSILRLGTILLQGRFYLPQNSGLARL